MSNQPRTRQELYDRIRQSSKETVILEDMIRLGFWGKSNNVQQDPAQELKRIQEIQRELTQKAQESYRLHNKDAFLRELRKQRMEESKRKRQETKERHERERKERALAWSKKKEQDVTYLGERVSGGLNEKGPNLERLRQYGLPNFQTASEIALVFGLPIGTLRFLAFSRKTSTVSHYVRFRLPKKTGGTRLISAPMPKLKRAQLWILRNILEKVAPHEAAHGFVPERSIVSNAQPHIGSDVLVNVDLKDFFPTVSYRRVKGLFRSLGYSEAAAIIFALLCTEPDVEEVSLDGQTYFVALSDRHLPQGAPSSPGITNLLCRRLDKRLTGLARKLGFTYTRYADDLTFSAKGDAVKKLCNVLKNLNSIVTHEGFTVHPDKTRVLSYARRQEVTGLVVNEKVGIPRDVLRRFRATLFQIEKDGPQGKKWGASSDVISAIQGFAEYVSMVNKEQGARFKEQVRRIIEKHHWTPPPKPTRPRRATTPEASTTAEAPTPTAPNNNTPADPKKKWWKLW